jgi:tripartite-type tricarboxylate transporter receptor subunit TctC
MPTRRLFLTLLAVLTSLGIALPARSESWPQRPVKIVVPFAPGGNTDGIARIVAQRLSEVFKQPFVVENRAGAGGAIASEAVARSPADGHTLIMATLGQIAITPAMTKVAYDPVKDFAPISVIGTNPFVLIAHPSVPARTLKELVDYARREPDKLAYAATFGGLSHLAMALFVKRAGIEVLPVMYKGGAAPLTDVVAGHVQLYLTNLSGVPQYAATGALRPLAVSNEKRVPQMPEVPTFIESGFPGFKMVQWNGLLAPAGTPREIVDRLAKEIGNAVKDPNFIERLAALDVDPLGNTPEEFAAMIAADIPLWAEAVKIAGAEEK